MRKHSLERIAIVDWDVHHGNGTEAIFYEDNRVLTISMHQDRLFPEETGQVGDSGIGEGEGCNLNIPLPAGSGHAAYLAAFRRVVVPALNRYQPELIVVASGLDANLFDPLGRMMATSETYRSMTEMVMEAADRLCEGRLVLCHEGGYSEAYAPLCGLAILEQLSGHSSGVTDPYLPSMNTSRPMAIPRHEDEAISKAERQLDRVPTPSLSQ